jgi:hypothetical protein
MIAICRSSKGDEVQEFVRMIWMKRGSAGSRQSVAHYHALVLGFYFHCLVRIGKTLSVLPAIAAGIVAKALHEVIASR